MFLFLKKYFIYLFLYRGEGRDKERERNINVWLPLMWPPLGTWPATQACALTGNWTSGSLVHSPHSIHWATPARARCFLMYYINVIYDYFFTYTACLYYTFLCDFLFSLKVHFKDIFIKSMHTEQTFLKTTMWYFIYEAGPQNIQHFSIKNCVFILTCLNFSYLQSTFR